MGEDLYFEPVADTSGASDSVAQRVRRIFQAKNSGHSAEFLNCFSQTGMTYSDGTLGRRTEGWDNFFETIRTMMPRWKNGRSFPLRIVGDEASAVVMSSDTPELFGAEIRAIAAIDFDQKGLVTRWVDYWDSSAFDDAVFARLKVPDSQWPKDFGLVRANTDPAVEDSCRRLHYSLSSAGDLSELLSYDAVWEDMALRIQLRGAAAIAAMTARVRETIPFGTGSMIHHVLGGPSGCGYEWIGSSSNGSPSGIFMLLFDAQGRIANITVTYDSARLSTHERSDLILASTT